jgi:hypothetical protein
MRIYDRKSDQELDEVTIYLTPDEAIELASYCQNLSEHPENHHMHFNDLDSTREITLAVYTAGNIRQFDERSRQIIGDDWKRPSTGPKVLKKARTIPFDGSS